MKSRFSYLKPIDFLAFLLNLVLLLLSILVVYFHKNLPPLIPLWFSKPWGELRLAPPSYLWLIPLLLGSFTLFNIVIARFLFKQNLILARILIWASFFVGFILLFSLERIVLTVI